MLDAVGLQHSWDCALCCGAVWDQGEGPERLGRIVNIGSRAQSSNMYSRPPNGALKIEAMAQAPPTVPSQDVAADYRSSRGHQQETITLSLQSAASISLNCLQPQCYWLAGTTAAHWHHSLGHGNGYKVPSPQQASKQASKQTRTHTHTHSYLLTYSPTHRLTRSRTHSLTHLLLPYLPTCLLTGVYLL